MRIAAVSDIHGNLPALDAVLAAIAQEGVDLVVNLGDIASGPLWPAETCDRLLALDLPTIRGNHERQVLGEPARMSASDAWTRVQIAACHLEWFAALSATCTLADGEVLCVHGTPASDLQYLLETVTPDFGAGGSKGLRAATPAEAAQRLGSVAARLVLCGHTHVPRAVTLGASLVVNPGSVGLQAYDDDHPHPHYVENGSPYARWALAERTRGGRWTARLLQTAYDHEASARRAEAHGRGDWADALRTGRVGRTEREVVGR
jgi:predicted phosphodiesterase